MLKKLLSVMLAVAVVSQGTARAEEPERAMRVSTVKDRAALLAHIDGRVEGDRIVVATDAESRRATSWRRMPTIWSWIERSSREGRNGSRSR